MSTERLQPDNTPLSYTSTQVANQERSEQKAIKRKMLLNKIIYPISAIVALPTGILSGFAALESDQGTLRSLNSIHAIGNLLMNQSFGHFFYGFVCLLATIVVLTGLNKKYLLGSTQTVLNLIKNNIIYLKNKFSKKQCSEQRFLFIENGLFLWCFMTSLIFAEIGKETMAFLGTPGELMGFYLNLIVYFATRFAGARRFFRGVLEKKHMATLLDEDQIIKKTALVVGYILAFVSAVPIIINFIPECVKGLQMLLHSNLYADRQYQNMAAITLGLIAVLPTVFFYSISIKDLPKHWVNTVLLFHKKIRSRHYKKALVLVLFTILAFAASYFAGIGFRLVGTSNIQQEYLSYLNQQFANLMPNGLFIACLLMFWSHLQHLINEREK